MTDLDKRAQECLAKADNYRNAGSQELVDGMAQIIREQQALIGEWERKAANWFASPEAAQRLDGYRELAMRACDAEAERDRLLAERDALRADAEQHVSSALSKAAAVARAACFSLGTPNCGAAAAVAEHAVLQLRRELSEAQEKSGE